jgi:PAS domain S-box-containing protein
MVNREAKDKHDLSQFAPQTTLQSAVEAYAQADALFSSIGDGAVATDEFGRITKINQAALDILGFKEKEVLGKWFPKALQAYDEAGRPIKLMDRPITQAFLTGKPVIARTLYKQKNGALLPVACTVSPLVLSGRPIGAIELFRDITTEYEIDRMKSDFISLASHQLRTPLSAIKTYSHMLIDGFMGPVTPGQRKALRTIVSASNRMNELISTLLNVSRIETGNVIVSAKNINLNHIIDEVFKELALAAETKQIELTSKLPKTPLIIKGDNLIVKEIVINLVSNALKYTPDNGKVQVQCRKGTRNVLISVKDNGMGIPKNAREQVFSKFYRAQNVVRHETSGTGLGLYLVKGLVETLGGTIWFESVENSGSTFYVRLPIAYNGKPLQKTEVIEDLPIVRGKKL